MISSFYAYQTLEKSCVIYYNSLKLRVEMRVIYYTIIPCLNAT